MPDHTICHCECEDPCDPDKPAKGCPGTHPFDNDRRCARVQRCANREKATEHCGTKRWAGAELDRRRGMCPTCTLHLRLALEQIPRDYVELHTLLGQRGTGDGQQVRVSKDLPIPLSLAVVTLQESLVSEVDTWIEPVCELFGIDWLSSTQQALTKPQARVERACRVLATTVDSLLEVPAQDVPVWDPDGLPAWDDEFYRDTVLLDGVDGGLRLLRLHELVRVVAGRSDLVHRLPAPCPGCDKTALVRENGSDTVQCEACKDRWTYEDYKRLCLVLCSEENLRIKACDMCDKKGLLPNRKLCAHKPVEVAA